MATGSVVDGHWMGTAGDTAGGLVDWCQDTSESEMSWIRSWDPRHFSTIELVPKYPDSLAPLPQTLRHWYRTVSTVSHKDFCYNRPYRRKVLCYSLLSLKRTT